MNIQTWFSKLIGLLEKNETIINELDTFIGDGDHGSNIVRGFKACLKDSNFLTCNSFQEGLVIISNHLMNDVGGSSGPLYGIGFLAIAETIKGKANITNADLSAAFQSAFDRVSELGGTKLNEKTVIDPLHACIAAFKNSSAKELDFVGAAKAAYKVCVDEMPLAATKGRASYLGERSKDHMDPGMYSFYVIMCSLADINPEPAVVVKKK
ncbi:MAG: dihydroxyacetone kinase subunit L [Mycoplasmataceae bacterium]|nr:dihydroxyacetone kinase subunit L [Mycoplasmataceae bacterium]